MRFPLGLLLAALPLCAQTAGLEFLNHNRPVLDAHNCYPYKGEWTDRIDRALATGFPVGIEQDLAWAVDPATGKGRIAISHEAKTTGREPGLREYFFEKVRLFGSAHTKAIPSNPKPEHDRLLVTLPPEQLLFAPPTNYRRWWNNSWYAVEEGGQHQAGEWTAADDARLRALVDHAHKLGYWIRFYTLDGFAPGEDKGWGEGYNFGSREAVQARWKAAQAAGVNLIATDQYEDLAAAMKK